jgi:hypothetical protein
MSGSSQTGVRETSFIARLFDAQDCKCFICGEPMIRGEAALRFGKMGWTREHVFPRGGSGWGLRNNIVLSHPFCNGKRGHSEPTEAEIQKAIAIYEKIGMIAFAQWDQTPAQPKRAEPESRYAREKRHGTEWAPTLGDLIGSIPLTGGEGG